MSEKKHAVLSASSAHRWLACPPSALACASVKDTASEYAQQGTDAHSLCEYKLLKSLGQKAEDPTENLTYFDEEMVGCADAYAEFVQEQVEAPIPACWWNSGLMSPSMCRRASAPGTASLSGMGRSR